MQRGNIGGASEAKFEKLKVVVDPGLMVVEILVVDHRALNFFGVRREAVSLRYQSIR